MSAKNKRQGAYGAEIIAANTLDNG